MIHADPNPGQAGSPASIRREKLRDVVSPERAAGASAYRVEGLSEARITRVCKTAQGYFERGLPFDNDFDLRTPEKLYCTELVWRAFGAAGVDLCGNSLSGSKKFLLPVDLIRGGKLRWIADL